MNLDINKAINNMSIRFNIICMTCLEENFIKVVDQIALSNDMYNKFMSLKTYVDQNNIRPVIKNNWAIISKTIRANILYYINLSHEDNLFAILQKKQKLSDLINNKYLLLCFIDVLLNLDAEEYSGLYKIYNEDCNYDFVGGKPTKTIYNYTYNVWTGLPGLSYKSTDKLIDKYSVYDIVVNKQYPDIRLTKTGKNSIVALMDGSKFHERVVLSKCPNISHYTASQILYEYSLSDILSNISILYNYKVVKKRTITISKDIADNAYKILCYKK